MVYSIIKYILRLYFPFFFKKVHLTGIKNIPKNSAVIFAVNHQNTFLDAVLVAYSLKKNVFFLVRSDLFKKGIINTIFKSLYLIPIHRREDKVDNISKKNEETFTVCQKYLAKQQPVLIFPEGNSKAEYRLSPLKKGLARLAFQTVEKNNNQKLYIVPVGINYENHHSARKQVWIEYDSPILVNDFLLINKNYAKGINTLTKKIENQLNTLVLTSTLPISNHFFELARKKEITSNLKLKQLFNEYIDSKKSTSKSTNFSILFLKSLYFPAYFLTNIILKTVNDNDFTLSIKCFSWLIFGSLQICILFIIALSYSGLTIALLFSSIFTVLSLVLLKRS